MILIKYLKKQTPFHNKLSCYKLIKTQTTADHTEPLQSIPWRSKLKLWSSIPLSLLTSGLIMESWASLVALTIKNLLPGDGALIPESGRSPEEGNGYPLRYSCLEKSMDRGRSLASYSPWGRKESEVTNSFTFLHSCLNRIVAFSNSYTIKKLQIVASLPIHF